MTKHFKSKNRYQLRYIGEPSKEGDLAIIRSARSEIGLEKLFKVMESNPKYADGKSAIIDMQTSRIVKRPKKKTEKKQLK